MITRRFIKNGRLTETQILKLRKKKSSSSLGFILPHVNGRRAMSVDSIFNTFQKTCPFNFLATHYLVSQPFLIQIFRSSSLL